MKENIGNNGHEIAPRRSLQAQNRRQELINNLLDSGRSLDEIDAMFNLTDEEKGIPVSDANSLEKPVMNDVDTIAVKSVRAPLAQELVEFEIIDGEGISRDYFGHAIGNSRLEIKKEGFEDALLRSTRDVVTACKIALFRDLDTQKGTRFHPGR